MQSTPLKDFIGLIFPYVSSSFLKVTIGLFSPGVDVMAPNNVASAFLAILIVSSGIVSPVLLKHSLPAGAGVYSKFKSK